MKFIRHKIIAIIQYFFLIAVAFIAAMPLLSCMLTSLKTDDDLLNSDFFSIPDFIGGINNYYTILRGSYFRALGITAIIIVVSTLVSSLLSAMIAYVVCRFNFRGKKLLLAVITAMSFVPSMAVQVYIFPMISSMHLVNTVFGYIILISGADIISIAIFSRYYGVIPKSIDEAAVLDGCSLLSVFFRIHLPMLEQAFLTTAIIKAIFVYNEYYIANLYLLNKNKYCTITTLLYSYSAPYGTRYNIICAGVILAILPTTIMFLLFQKRIYNGLSITNQGHFGGQ